MVCGDWNKLDWLNYFSSVFNLMESDHFLKITVNLSNPRENTENRENYRRLNR